MTTFAADIRYWPTVADFEAHLAAHSPDVAPWAIGATVHHTAVPTVAQWRGRTSVEGARDYYIGLGWSAAPHLFVGPDGIWQLTPLNLPGIHAGACNATRWGVEVVGNYDLIGWREPINSLARGVLVALYRWRNLPAVTLRGHRECLNNKSCPGDAIDMSELRTWLAGALASGAAPVEPPPSTRIYTPDSPLLGQPAGTVQQLLRYLDTRAAPEYRDGSLATIINAYARIGGVVGLDWFLAVAQFIHETGGLTSWWSQRPRRNPAGLGVTGATRAGTITSSPGLDWAWTGQRWAQGLSFARWDPDAVQAHLGRLLAYALRDEQATPAQLELIRFALRLRPLPAKVRGCAPTLRGLGGTWAVPGTTYAARIALLANQIARLS